MGTRTLFCFQCGNISEKEAMTIATIIKFEVILVDTRTETVSVNKLLNRHYLQNDFTLTVHRLYIQLVNTEGIVPKRRAKMQE